VDRDSRPGAWAPTARARPGCRSRDRPRARLLARRGLARHPHHRRRSRSSRPVHPGPPRWHRGPAPDRRVGKRGPLHDLPDLARRPEYRLCGDQDRGQVAEVRLYVMDLEGQHRREIPARFEPGSTASVFWSPDGSRLALNAVNGRTKRGRSPSSTPTARASGRSSFSRQVEPPGERLDGASAGAAGRCPRRAQEAGRRVRPGAATRHCSRRSKRRSPSNPGGMSTGSSRSPSRPPWTGGRRCLDLDRDLWLRRARLLACDRAAHGAGRDGQGRPRGAEWTNSCTRGGNAPPGRRREEQPSHPGVRVHCTRRYLKCQSERLRQAKDDPKQPRGGKAIFLEEVRPRKALPASSPKIRTS